MTRQPNVWPRSTRPCRVPTAIAPSCSPSRTSALPVRDRAIRLAARYIEPAVLGAMVADGENAARRNAGLGALERQGPYAVPHLTVMLGDSDPELVMFALQSLARIGYAPAGRSILPLLHHGDPNVAQAAIEAVGQLRTREAVPALLKLVDGELWLQLAAINALGAIGAPEAVGPLMALVPDSVLAEPAVQALRSIAAPESLETLLGLLPVVRERALRDPLLLAIAVVIDLHPDPAPLLAQAGPALAESDGGHAVPRPDARRSRRVTARETTRASSVPPPRWPWPRGLEALEPGLLARLASDTDASWLEGLFRRFPAGLAARRARLLGHADADVRSGVLRAARFEEYELPELFDHLEDAHASVRAAACYAMGRLELDSTAPLLVERLRRGEPHRAGGRGAGAGPVFGGGVGRSRDLPASGGERVAAGDRARRTGRAARARVRRPGTRAGGGPPAARAAGGPARRRAAPRRAADVLLLRALADRHQATQVEALELLVARGGEQSVAVLVALLGTADSLRFHVIRALGHCRAQAGAPPSSAPCSRMRAARAAADRRRAHPHRARRGSGSSCGSGWATPRSRCGASRRRAWPTWRASTSCRVLLPLAEDADWSIRNEAARGLGRLAKPMTRQVLLALARDVEPVVAATARASLERLQPEAIRISA